MRKILLTIQYKGTEFSGWQKQDNALTVQGVLETHISKLLGEVVTLHASGRTDSGVHAVAQTAHFETNSTIPTSKLPAAINFGLNENIAVTKAKDVSPNFHARYNVKQKTYLYKIYLGKISKPLKRGLCTQVKFDVRMDLMKQAAHYFLGEHDFYGFCSSGSSVKDFVRNIYKLDIKKIDDEIHFLITGNGFLYNMVRIIVGTLIAVGSGKIKPDEIPAIIESKDRTRAGKTMPPDGLYLYNVEY